jgi:hypothetical protein
MESAGWRGAGCYISEDMFSRMLEVWDIRGPWGPQASHLITTT